MKIRIHRLCALALISPLWLFAFAAQAAAQGQTFNPVSRSSKLRGTTGKAQKATPAAAAAGYNYEVLYSFGSNSTDGYFPSAGVIQDAAGNLYGTTFYGGANSGGTIFKVDPTTGQETVLYNFCSSSAGRASCTDGEWPGAGLIQDTAGNFYGTTTVGGANDEGGQPGSGTVFKLDPTTGQETVLYNFCSGNCSDGYWPLGGVIQDAAGNLYGTTASGGANGGGTVFKVDGSGETVLYSFCSGFNCPDGAAPEAGLVRDAAGNLYGTTSQGGGSNPPVGTVFKVDGSGETVLYSFCPSNNYPSCTDGDTPYAGLIEDAAGNLYGTTMAGGNSNSNCRDPNGFDTCGTMFKLDSTGRETVLYSFCSAAKCTDGANPDAGLIQDAAGNLYGTTEYGGVNGYGTIFKVDNTGQETVLYSFCSVGGANCTDGHAPVAGLIQDAAGNLYGTTPLGGANTAANGGYGGGTVFKLALLMTPTVTVTPSSSSITTAQALSVTVAVSGGSGNPTPTGTVTLTSGSYSSAATALTSGSATINIPAGSLAVGTDTLKASYSGDSNYATATGSNSVAVTVPATPTVTVTPSSSSITTAQALNVTVAVSGGSGNPIPTGTVTLTSGSYSSGATTLTSGSATINIPAGSLAVGTDALKASYSGDSNYATATGSNSVAVTVPTFTVAGTAVSVSPGATTGNTSTITVTPSGGFTGNVTLTAAITSSPSGAQYLPTLSFGSTSPVNIGTSAGTATLTISTTAPTTGAFAYPAHAGVRWYAGGTTLAFGLCLGIGICIPARGRSWRMRLGALVLLVILAVGLLACGSSGSGGGTGNPGTTPGAYTITVTGTSGSTTAKGTVTLTVQQSAR
jgi:uncharacterized repeat protein (TIGR03803 family)